MSRIDHRSLGLRARPGFIRAAAATAATPPYSVIYAFGDSLSDAGNDYILTGGTTPVAPIYSDGRFTNGPVWVQDLAASLGEPAVTPSAAGGTDFAFGGAETGSTPLHTADLIDLPSQLSQFAQADPTPQANALYTVSIGSNDVLDAIAGFAADPATALADVGDAVANVGSFVGALAADGAHTILVMNTPDLGKVPAETSQGPNTARLATALASLFDNELNTTMAQLAAADHLTIRVLDAYSLLDQAIAHPQQYGLTDVTDPVWSGDYTNANSGTLAATGTAQAGYLFWDSLHPTATSHAALAAAGVAALFPSSS